MEISIAEEGWLRAVLKPLPLQLRRVMRLTALLLIVGCLHVSARSYSQNVSFSGKNVPLQAVFATIEKQTGLSFFFNYTLLKDARPVTLELRDVPLDDALHQVLKNENLEFYRNGKTIFIVRKDSKVPPVVTNPPDTTSDRAVSVKGKVTNQQGESLVGATVTVKNKQKATLTDERGIFQLKGVPLGSIIEVTYQGYQKSEVEIDGREVLQVALVVANSKLDEVQVIAYGNTTQRLSTGDQTTVKSEDIARQPVNNAILALKGLVPGMQITQTSGLPGGATTVQIRGKGTIDQSSDPLYIVDGVPYNSSLMPGSDGLGLVLGNGGINPLSFINPADIESITVLKDADATAIYGSRAANGVVLITTKKGKPGKMQVTANVRSGGGNVTRKADLMNTAQYLEMREEAFKNDNITPTVSNALDLVTYSQTAYTDWQKVMIGKTSQYSDAQASISGGDVNTQYLIGGGYHKETTVFPGDWNDQKASAHFNLTSTSSNRKFKALISGNFLSDNNLLSQTDFTSFILLAPNSPSLYNPNGTLNWTDFPDGNPFTSKLITYKAKTINFLGNSVLSYIILPGLELKASLGYNDIQLIENTANPIASFDPAYQITTGTASFNNNNVKSWIIEPQLNYQMSLGRGKLTTLLGATGQRRETVGQIVNGNGYPNDALLGSLAAAASITNGRSIYEQYRYSSIFGRINYNWSDRYILDINARRDGSSRFGPGKQFGDFGAVGAGWIFSNEEFIKKNVPLLSFGKIRVSYGTSGNEPAASYQFLELYNFTSNQNTYGGSGGIYPTNLSVPKFSWELDKKLEAGLELGFLKERILISGSYYRSRSSNQLVNSPLPSITGFGSIIANLPATVQNLGWEFTLNTINLKGKNFSWSSGFNLTAPQNKLVAFPGIENSAYYQFYTIGQPITAIKGFNFAGVDPATGQYQFYDHTGKLTLSPTFVTDFTKIINTMPKFYGGFQNRMKYKDFELNIDFYYVKQLGQNDLFTYATANPGYFFDGATGNQPVSVLNRWQKTGDIKPFEAYTTSYPQSFQSAQTSNAAYSDASFIRLKNLAIAYDFPKKALSRAHIDDLRVFIQAQNLFTITHYNGIDPENQSLTSLPPLRVITGGIQVTL